MNWEIIKKKKDSLNTVLLAVICTIECMLALTASVAQARYIEIGAKPNIVLYALGTLLMCLALYGLMQIIGKPVLVAGIYVLLLNIIAIISYYELLFHGTVLSHQDIGNISTALRHIGSYTFRISRPVFVIIMLLAITIAGLAVVLFRKVAFRTNRIAGIVSIGTMIVLLWLFVYSPYKIVPNSGWSLELKYYRYSFIVGTMDNLGKALNPVNEPSGYNKNAIEDATGLSARATEYPDIIMILNETYYDMGELGDFATDVPFMDNYDCLKAYKGHATTYFVGGGTNASEYELLTSNALTLLNSNTPFNDLNLNESRSLVEYLKKLGYSTMAAHSEPGKNYHRETAWKDLDFDFMHFREDFSEQEYYGDRWNETDSSVFRNFTRFYESMPEEQPRFAYLLTIQNHGDWGTNSSEYDIVHIGKTYGLSDYNIDRINEYLTGIKLTDDFIKELTEYFSGTKRKVIVYMVGDHSPSIVSEIKSEQLNNDNPEAFNLKKRQTPYFIWSNYDINFSVLPDNSIIDICALPSYVLSAAQLPLSPYYNQLLQLSKSVQCFTNISIEEESGNPTIGFINTDGAAESIYAQSDEAEAVRDYFFMEYNRLQPKERIDRLFDP